MITIKDEGQEECVIEAKVTASPSDVSFQMAGIIKDVYADNLKEMLRNSSVLNRLLDREEEVTFEGEIIIPIHTARNQAVSFGAEDDMLPQAGGTSYTQIAITREELEELRKLRREMKHELAGER